MALVLNGSGITSANIADGTIVNADINSSAAIDGSKLTGVVSGIGVNQTWQDMTSSRSHGTIYTNSTGKTIVLTMYSSGTSDGALLYVRGFLNNVNVIQHYGGASGGAGTKTRGMTLVIPNGDTYEVYSNGNLTKWYELR